MKLYIMRHGETDGNVERRLQGHADIPLNEKGRALAQVTGEHLKDVDFAAVYSSPLCRAVETAKLALGGRQIPVIIEPRIMEICFGEIEGHVMSGEDSDVDPAVIDNFFFHPENYEPPTGGETIQSMLDRTHDFYEEITNNPDYEDQNILISSHGAATRALLQSVYKDGNIWRDKVPPNCSVTIVTLDHGEVVSVDLDRTFYEN